MANRTLQFFGYAYGSSPVVINAHINGQTVFSGEVPTVNQPLPVGDNPDLTNAPVLFSVENSALVPTEFSGSLPMTISVATGNGIALGEVFCNYMQTANSQTTLSLENSSITGNLLSVGTVVSGAPATGQFLYCGPGGDVVGQTNPGLCPGARIVGEGPTAGTYVVQDLFSAETNYNTGSTVIGAWTVVPVPGNETTFLPCYTGSQIGDPRTNVSIDNVAQNPDREGEDGTWTWVVPQGSTIAYDLNVSTGNVA